MRDGPDTKYAKSGDTHIAYQVFGDGPVDLALFGGTVSNVEMIWENDRARRFLERLSSFARVIMFDKRGVGMSDPVRGSEYPTLEERMADVGVVLDAAGSGQTFLFGNSEGGPLAVMFAAARPEQTKGLVLYSTFARIAHDPVEYPVGMPKEVWRRFLEVIADSWGDPDVVPGVLPSTADDPEEREWWARFFRRSISPGALLDQFEMNYLTDVTAVAEVIRTPTLVVHGVDDGFIRVDHGRALAEAIPGARFVGLEGGDHMPFAGMAPAVADEVEEFVTGTRSVGAVDRKLSTVLFTDLVDSTARAARVGDEAWRRLLDRHDELSRRELARHRGVEVKHTGDGFLATFDGPAQAIRCGEAMCDAVRREGLEVRVGVHTGEIELRDGDVGGIAVHIGARVMAQAGAGEVLVSQSVPPLVVGSGLAFDSRGTHDLKGVPGQWELFAVGAT